MADDMMNDDTSVRRTVLKTELLQMRLQTLSPAQPEPIYLPSKEPAREEFYPTNFDIPKASALSESEQQLGLPLTSSSSSSQESEKPKSQESEDERLKEIAEKRTQLIRSLQSPEPQPKYISAVIQRRVGYLEEQNRALLHENESLRTHVTSLTSELSALQKTVERLEAENARPSRSETEKYSESEAVNVSSLDNLNGLMIRLKTENRYLRMECDNRRSMEKELERTQEDLRKLRSELGLEIKALQNKLLVAQERADSVLRDFKRSLELEQEKFAKASAYIRMLEAKHRPASRTPDQQARAAPQQGPKPGFTVNDSIYLNNYKSERPSSSNQPKWQASEPGLADSLDRISSFFPKTPDPRHAADAGKQKKHLTRVILQQQALQDPPQTASAFKVELTPKRSDLFDQEESSTLRYDEGSEEQRLASDYKLRYESRVEALYQQSARPAGRSRPKSPMRHPLDSLSKADSFLADFNRKVSSLGSQKYDGSN